jgi:mono/diheme cytochrome c family protein
MVCKYTDFWHATCSGARVNSIRSRASVLTLLALAGCTADILPADPRPGSAVDPATVPITLSLAAPGVRLLSAPEYRRTVGDLLGLEVTTPLTQADWTAGYDNGSNIQVDDNLLSALVDEAGLLAEGYLASRIALDFPCYDASAIADACVQDVIATLGRRAHRRPLTAAQRAELFTFFQSASDKPTGVKLVVARLLTSAQFLYRSEVGKPVAAGSLLRELDAFEKATLLSYTLTGSMPDEALLSDAEARKLDDAGLRRHVRRLWASPRARARVGEFFRQWLKVTRLDDMAAHPADYKKLPQPELGASLKAEFDAFIGAVVFDGRGTLPALFSESFTVVDAYTAPLYLAPAPAAPTRLELDPNERRGVLTLASTMAAIANAEDPSRDRPVVRGLMVKEQLLCEEVGPPSGINTQAARAEAQQTPNFEQLTTREQYEAMMQQGAHCQSCHQQFMPLGFALGRYDALGRYRVEQRGRPVDATVRGVPFADREVDLAGGTALADAVAQSPNVASCFSKNFLRFTTGAQGANAETLSAAVLQKLGDGPLGFARFVEEALANPQLYYRRGAPLDAAFGAAPIASAAAPLAGVTTELLPSGAELFPDGARVSSDGKFRLIYQQDGNLVLYRVGGGPLWSSRTSGTSKGRTAMQGDGNLVVYDAGNAAKFHTGTNGNPGASLHLDPAGVLFIVAPNGQRLWSSGGTP